MKLVRGKPLIYMKGRLPQSLTINQTKLKPLPENPRIERHGDFSFKENFHIFIVYEKVINNIMFVL